MLALAAIGTKRHRRSGTRPIQMGLLVTDSTGIPQHSAWAIKPIRTAWTVKASRSLPHVIHLVVIE